MDLKVYQLNALPCPIDLSGLSDEERSFHPRRQLARALLRRELQQRLGCPATEIRFSYNEHGKPMVEGLHFNISHSGDCLCLAFHHRPIGVDVEYIKPRPKIQSLAARFMGDEQFAAFVSRGCPPDEFYACWCAAEAMIKHSGHTVWQAKHFPFLFRHGNIVPLFEDAPQLLLFSPLPGYCGAVAYT